MKKAISLLLALVMCLSLCACGGGNDTPETTEASPKSSELKVGDTATGQLFDITIQSVEAIDKIENGFVWHMWSPAEQTTYQDITAEEGYTIVKITYSYTYKGKEKGEFGFEISLDYDDGYAFDGLGGHALPALDSTPKIGFEEYYDIGAITTFPIDDPLTFTGGEGIEYIIVNNEVLSITDKPFVLKVDIPTAAWEWVSEAYGYILMPPQSEPETFIYNLR